MRDSSLNRCLSKDTNIILQMLAQEEKLGNYKEGTPHLHMYIRKHKCHPTPLSSTEQTNLFQLL